MVPGQLFNIPQKFDNITSEKHQKVKTKFGPPMRLVVNNVCNKLIHRVFSCVLRNRTAEAGKI